MNMLKYFLLVLLSLSSFFNLNSQETIIKGTSDSYANGELVFFKYSDQVSYEETKLANTVFDENGVFEIKLNLDEPTYVFTHLGTYFAYLFAEPGKTYEVLLPEKNEKTTEDLLNPYFQETFVHLGTNTVDENELNVAIRMFNDSYMAYFNKYIIDNYERKNFDMLEKELEKLEKVYSKNDNEFFKSYRFYKYGYLNNSTLQQKSKEAFLEYFNERPVLYENTAYMDLFNQIFNEYFQYLGRTEKGKDIFTSINAEKSYENLIKALQKQNSIKNTQLLELIVLKNIHDEYYDSKFSRSGLIEVLNQLKEQTAYDIHREIASTIYNKVTRLQSGYDPPKFELYDTDSNLVSLSNYKGKYIYLNFCTTSSYACFSEYEMLKLLHSKHGEYLDIVTVSADASFINMKKFVDSKQYTWEFLHYANHSDVLKEYDIRAFPTYFLIDKKGKLVMSPAPSPRENFESHLFKLMRSRGDI
jgi:peroxiredoxin